MDEAWFTTRRTLHWGGGLLAGYCLLAIAVSAGSISADAEQRANQNLNLAGHKWAQAEAHGRGFAILGVAPSEAAGAAAIAIVERDWSARRAWTAYSIQPTALAPTPLPGAKAGAAALAEAQPPLQASGPPINDSRLCQSLLDSVLDDDGIAFEPGGAALDPASLPLLDALGAALMRCETVWADISGHADATGDAAADLALSQARADAVADYLKARGVPTRRLAGVGRGSGAPLADHATAAGRAPNRQIEFRVVTIGDSE